MTITTTTQTSPIPTTPKIVATNVTLDSTKPYYVFWLDNLSENGYISVCSDYDDNLQLFVTSGNYLYNYILYDSNGLYNPVGDLSSNNIYTNDDDRPRSITSTSNCFTIVKTNGNAASLATLLFRRINQQSGNCYNNNIIDVYSTIFSTNDAYTNNGNCETIFLASLSEFPIIPIDSIFSNSLITVKSAINGNSLASINSTDPSNWSNFVIYTNALSIISTQQISVQLMYANSSITKDKQFNQRGIMASPSYSGFSTKTLGSKMLYQLNNYAPTSYKMATGFVVKHLDSNCVVYIRNNDNQQNHT
uniref:Uncharacterized protein n=1 Tax=Panagrolaimus superbus TaxID=310955 RepID=A0A914ZEZ8_9BILA